jgi:hypothetical protein
MTPERLRYLMTHCKHRDGHGSAADVARFLGVSPITLRRWTTGERPVPRQAEIIMEILHFWPEISARAVDKLILAVDEGSKV